LNWPCGFLSFFSPVRFVSIQLASSPPFYLPGSASPPTDVAIPQRHVTLPSHGEVAVSASSFGNALIHRLPSRAETEALNPHHRRRSPSPYRPIPTLHCYKKIISTLVTLLITQPRLHFVSSLAEHHTIIPPPTAIVHFHRYPTPIILPHNNTHGDELVDHLSLPEHLIDM
jgi:hypothetical protein